MRILSFDPGYSRLGWGLVHTQGHKNSLELVGYGVIETAAKQPMSLRMCSLYQQITRLINDLKPDHITMERLYFSTNQKTAAGVYQAQGLILAAAGQANYTVEEMEPKRIKRILTNSGNATKQQMMHIVCRILNQPKITPDDAADAVAGAIAAYFHLRQVS